MTRNSQPDDPRRHIPRTDDLLAHPLLAPRIALLGRAVVKAAVTDAQRHARSGRVLPQDVLAHAIDALATTLCAQGAESLPAVRPAGEPRAGAGPRPVVNATGVLLHTNLGRAPLSVAARRALDRAAGATDVELDLATGTRGDRGRGALAALAVAVPAAGAAAVVNNNAAALALAAAALATGREIVVSRGELIEIGDGFRLPNLLVSAGARLREVGATNRTSVRDYAEAIGPDTGFVLKAHPSNYRVEGFTAEVSVRDLARLCADRGVPLVGDIGSGLLAPEPLLPAEPDAATWLSAGADLVTASGDKLLGGPQCGLLLGRADLVVRLRRHPLARAVRVDKLTLAALEATLRDPATPTRQALRVGVSDLRTRAAAISGRLAAAGVTVETVETVAMVGGGGAPGVRLPSAAVAVDERIAAALRAGDPAVLGRLEKGRCLLDLRSVPAELDDLLGAAVLAAAARAAGAPPCT